MKFHWEDNAEFIIDEARGETELIPEKRTYIIQIHGIIDCTDHTTVYAGGSCLSEASGCSITYDEKTCVLTCTLKDVPVCTQIRLLAEHAEAAENDIVKECFDFLNQAEIEFVLKDILYQMIREGEDKTILLSQLQAMELDPELLGVLTEIITA